MVGCRATPDGVVVVSRQTSRADQEDGNIDLERSLEDRLQVIVGLGVDDDGGCAALVRTHQRRAKAPAGAFDSDRRDSVPHQASGKAATAVIVQRYAIDQHDTVGHGACLLYTSDAADD